jgi:hypothetical protein
MFCVVTLLSPEIHWTFVSVFCIGGWGMNYQTFPLVGLWDSGVARNFFGGVQQIQLRTEGRENGDLGAVAP